MNQALDKFLAQATEIFEMKLEFIMCPINIVYVSVFDSNSYSCYQVNDCLTEAEQYYSLATVALFPIS